MEKASDFAAIARFVREPSNGRHEHALRRVGPFRALQASVTDGDDEMRVAASLAAGLALAGTLAGPVLAQTTVDQMTCADASRSAIASGRYYKRTGFGVVPIMPIVSRLGATRQCLPSEWAVPQVERTRDTAACLIGYKCEEADPWVFDRP